MSGDEKTKKRENSRPVGLDRMISYIHLEKKSKKTEKSKK